MPFLIAFFVILSWHPVDLISLFEYKASDILTLTSDGCVVAITNVSPVAVNKLLSVAQLFVNEPVNFGRIDAKTFTWPGEKFSQRQLEYDLFAGDLVVFEKLPLDRNCLLPPVRTEIPKYSTISSKLPVTDIVTHVNEKCFVFVSPSGGLTIPGIHRQHILENLFTVAQLPGKVSVGHLVQQYGALPLGLQYECEFGDNFSRYAKEPSKLFETCSFHPEENPIERKDQKMVLPQCLQVQAQDISPDEFFYNFIQYSKPVIIRGGNVHWRAFNKWTNSYLREKYGHEDINVKLTPGGDFEGVDQASNWEDYSTFNIPKLVQSKLRYPDLVVVRPASHSMKFSEFLDLIEWAASQPNRNISAYLEYSSIPDNLPELQDDLEELPYAAQKLVLRHLNIWLSDGNTLGRLHFDPFDNFLCQMRGSKQVIMFEPHHNTQLYEGHIPEATLTYNKTTGRFRKKRLDDSTSMVMSPVDILAPDLARFPDFAAALPLNCTIDEGDVLFMPAFWWHEVYSRPNQTEKRNLAVNYWYEPFLTKEFPCPECTLDVNPRYRDLL